MPNVTFVIEDAFYFPSILIRMKPVAEPPPCLFSPPSESINQSSFSIMWLLTSVPQSPWLVLSHEPGMAARQVAPAHWFLSMPFSTTSSSFNLNPYGSGPHHISDQSAFYIPKCLQPTSSSLRLTNKSREKATASPHLPDT